MKRLDYCFVIENIQKQCKVKDYELIDINFEYKNNYSPFDLRCKKCEHIWTTKYSRFVNDKHGCPKCGGRLKITQEEAEYNILNKCTKMGYTVVKNIEYLNNKSRVTLKCVNDGHMWSTTYLNFITSDRNCPKCGGSLKLTHDEAKSNIEDICNEYNYNIIEFEYKNSNSRILLKCNNDNNTWDSSYTNFVNGGYRCRLCNNSKGEKYISDELTKQYIIFETQKRFKDCKYKKSLSFDFYLSEYNVCIEYDGEQHFRVVEHWGGEEGFKVRQYRDKIKTEFCINNNIKLYRIKYNDNISDEVEKIINDIKIN